MDSAAIATAAADAAIAAVQAASPLWAQAQAILAAACQVMQAWLLLSMEAVAQLRLWSTQNPVTAAALSSVPLQWVLYLTVRGRINANWEQGMRDAKTARFAAQRFSFPSDAADWKLQMTAESDAENDDTEVAVQHLHRQEKASSLPGSPSLAAAESRNSMTASSSSSLGTACAPGCDPASLLAKARALADLDTDCLLLLQDKLEVKCYGPGEAIFQRGSHRDDFMVVKDGEVLVEVSPPSERTRSEEYSLGPGGTVVGLLFVLASLDAGPHAVPPPRGCSVHNSTARAGQGGAEVISLPMEAFSEAFEAFPKAMRRLVERLCMRLAAVVFETLSTHFGLRQEFFVSAAYKALEVDDEELLRLSPPEVFRRILGHSEVPSRESDAGKRISAVLATASSVTIDAGQFAMTPHARLTHLMVLLEGDLIAETVDPSELVDRRCCSSSYSVSVGEALGELSVLIDRPSPVIYKCVSRCRFAVLPREAAQNLLELCPKVWCLKLLHLAAARTAIWLHRVDACLDWLAVEGGRCLYRKGDPMLGFFVVLSGRLIALEELPATAKRHAGNAASKSSQASQWKVCGIMQRGHVCGELDCLRETPYSQTVRASRDTEVCRITPTLFHLMAIDFPKAILYFSSHVGLHTASDYVASARNKVTITVVPATKDVNVQEVCANLTAALSRHGKTLHISPDSNLAEHGLRHTARCLDGGRLARLLADLEERCRWLVYEAEPVVCEQVTDWTRRCVRQADHILVAANFDGRGRCDVPVSENELYVEKAAPLYVERELLLLHAGPAVSGGHRGKTDDWFAVTAATADSLRPGVSGFVAHHTQLFFRNRGRGAMRSTRHYLHGRPWVRRWHHVRTDELGDWARCSRLLAGRGIGLCLGGGGARGNCHLGVIKALEELGIPVDVVSGTSFGALVGAMYSMSAPEPGSLDRLVKRVMDTQFSTRKMLMDLNFPRTSYFTGAYLNNSLKETFARRRCEDLLLPFACTSTDIVQFESKIHREGPLWRIVRASMSLVGFVPPLPHQERRAEDGSVCSSLLVDGGYVNQYPIEVLKEYGAGVVICVVACPDYGPVCTDYGDAVQGGLVTLRKTCGCRRRWTGPDPPSHAEIQERLMFLVESMKEPHMDRSDLVIYPEIESYGLLDFAKYKEIAETGYVAALPRLKEWLSSGSEAAELVKQAVESGNSSLRRLQSPEASYGNRRVYGTWRRDAMQLAGSVLRQRSASGLQSHSSPELHGGSD